MIRYALVCEAGHGFDGWFRSSDDFDTQSGRGLITCPHCAGSRVSKQIMAPGIARSDRAPAVQPAPVASQEVALLDSEGSEIRKRIAELRAFLASHSENVGPRFADEARKIHYGETEERSIHGQASLDDARALIDEGIGVLPIPLEPDERN